MATTWPLPVSAIKPMPERVPEFPVQLTVHSMLFSKKSGLDCHSNVALQQKLHTLGACLLHPQKWIQPRVAKLGAFFRLFITPC
jgi:hypothetical protein